MACRQTERESMTKAEKIALLQEWQRTIEAAEETIAPLIDVLKLEPGTPFIDGVHALMCDYTRLVARTLGDESGMLDWHWLENDMGKNKYPHNADENKYESKPIETAEDLLWLIDGD